MVAKLFAYLSYLDAPRALKWLAAIGFVVVREQTGDDGTIVHSEVRNGDTVLMVASNDQPYQHAPLLGQSTGAGLYLLVEDVEAIYRQAVTAGATPVIEPERTDWGSSRARVLDIEGYEWSFGTYEPGEQW
ncbi:VOC family protein [Mycobacterium sp.]|uniref:VOC family protein n=1 Tax=Mycobacterium sp. TaxID=1785 RepID=UPI003D12A144